MSALFLAARMRYLGNAELLADIYEYNPPSGFEPESWADSAQALTEALKAGKAIEPTPCHVQLLVESLEGNSLIGLASSNKRAGLAEVAKLIAKRLESYIGRPVRPELD
jgi:hypothetical protein